MTRIPSSPPDLYAAIVHPFFSPVALSLRYGRVDCSVQRPLARQRVILSHRVFAYYGLMSPSRHLPPAYLFRPGGSLSSGLIETDPERFPNLLRVSLPPCRRPYPGSRMEFRLFLLHSHWPSPSLHRLGICQLPAGPLWVVCDFGAATFALCCGPVGCLLFTGKSFYFRAFASWGRPQKASSITIRPNSQLPEPDFHRLDTQHYGLRAEKKRRRLNAFRKARTIKVLSWNDLCFLCFLFVHPLVFIRGGFTER